MTTQIMTVLAILVAMTIAFFTEIIPLSFVALAVPVAFQLTGILTATEAWAGFSNTTIITWLGLFIVGAMFAKTSVIYHIKRLVYKYGQGSGVKVLVICMFAVATLATLTSSTAALVVLAPIIDEICKDLGLETKKIIKPTTDVGLWASVQTIPFGSTFSYLAMFNAYIEAAGGTEAYGLFDFTLIKGPMLIALIAYYIIINRNLKTGANLDLSEKKIDEVKKNTAYTPFQEKCAAIIFVANVVLMVVAALTKIVPTYLVSTIFAILAVALRLLSEKEALNSISWSLMFLVAGTLPISTAMTKTGTGEWIAGLIQEVFPAATNAAVLAIAFCLVTTVVTHFMSNTAVWAAFGPIAATMGVTMGIDTRLVLAGVACGAIICFATPMANPGEAYIYQEYKFTMKEFFLKGFVPCLLMVVVFAVWAPFILNVLYG